MGCASSKVLGDEFAVEKENNGYPWGISMPTHHLQECPEDFHIVALTSSTYGILKLDPPKAPEEEGKEGMGAQSVKDVLNKLNNLESKADAGPQSWLEVSSMLENLKPGLEQAPPNPKTSTKSGKPSQQLDSVDINEIMMDIDEDTGLVKPKSVVARKAILKKAGNSLPIHTLEELDKRIGGGKANSTKKTPSPVATDFRSLLKPIGTVTAKNHANEEPLKDPALKSNEQKPVTSLSSTPHIRDGMIRKDSDLFDDDLLGSYKAAFPTLSEDDWKALELQEDVETEWEHGIDEARGVDATHSQMEAKEDHLAATSISGAEASQSKLTKETASNKEEKSTSLSSQSVVSGAKASPAESYEELCPPGGKHAVVLYTTSLRGIRKTYEDCIRVRDIVRSFGVLIDERDVSMHLEYRNELRELMQRLVTVPRLFVNGKYIGGVEKVCKLQEEGQLACLFEGSTKAPCSQEGACDGCANARFVPCFECNGSCKVVDDKRQVMRCSHCNENGVVQCPICS